MIAENLKYAVGIGGRFWPLSHPPCSRGGRHDDRNDHNLDGLGLDLGL